MTEKINNDHQLPIRFAGVKLDDCRPREEANIYRNAFLHGINPYIRYANYSTLPPYDQVKVRVLYDYEIIYVKSGHADVRIGNRQYKARQGDLFFLKPGVEHFIQVYEEPLVQPHIHFDLIYQPNFSVTLPVSFKNVDQMTEEEKSRIQQDVTHRFFVNFPEYIRINNPLYIEQLIFDVIYSYDSPEMFNELRLKWQFLRMLDQLLNEINWQQGTHGNLITERARLIKLYLERHLDRRITLEELAEVYHLDKSYISRCFHKVYGDSPIHYQLLLRLNRAKGMVLYTNLSLSDIAERNGFSSLQDFSRAFRRIENRSPSEFRQSNDQHI